MIKKKKPAKAKKAASPKRTPKKTMKAKTKKASNVISFTELFELRKKQRLEQAQQQQQQGWKDGTTGQFVTYNEQPKAHVNVRNGRTNGAGSRHK